MPPPSHSASLRLLAVKKGESKGTFKFLPRLKDHFFPLPLGGVWWNGAGDRGVCHGTDGLYFDYGAFVVMGDGRRGGATWCVCLYKTCT